MINIGNDRIKQLHKGNELVTRVYKGDELIYIDLETLYAYRMTIDTRLQNDGTSLSTDNTMILGLGETDAIGKNFKVYWGDGTDTVVDTTVRSNQTLKHEYPTPGEYQLKIVPTNFVNRLPVKGWLRTIQGIYTAANDIITGVSQNQTMYKVKSIDNKIPERGLCYGDGYSAPSTPHQTRMQQQFAWLDNIETLPEGWLENVEITSDITENNAYMMFYRFCRNGKLTNVNDVLIEISTFFNRMHITTAQSCFSGGFCNLDEVVIPDDFLVFEEPPYQTISAIIGSLFQYSFEDCKKVTIGERLITLNYPTRANLSSSGALSVFTQAFTNMEEFHAPECLIKVNAPMATSLGRVLGNGACNYGFTMKSGYTTSIDITDKFFDIQAPLLTDYSYMFSYNLMSSSARVAINFKAGTFKVTKDITTAENMFRELFSDMNSGGRFSTWEQGAIEINTSHCTSTAYMFYRKLGGSPISPGVIAPMNTDNVVNFSNMFYGYDTMDASDTIFWQDLLSSTANGVNFSYMFYQTYYGRQDLNNMTLDSSFFNLDTSNGTDFSYMFYNCFSVTQVTLDTGLFANIDTTNGQNFTRMFSKTYVRYNNTPTRTLNDVFDGMTSYNWASQTNVDDNYVVDEMFSFATYHYLTGSAQTVLQHFNFTPTRRNKMFSNQTNLTDYNTIDANWK